MINTISAISLASSDVYNTPFPFIPKVIKTPFSGKNNTKAV